MSKPIDGVGLAALGIGSVLVFAGMKGYSVLAVVQNLVTGKPIATGVSMTNPLTTPKGVAATDTPPVATPAGGGMSRDSLTQAWNHLNAVNGG